MRRYSFHPKRLAASVGFVLGMFALLFGLVFVAPTAAGVMVVFFGFMLVGTLFICPAWIMQPRDTPPPRPRGRHPQPAQVVRLIRKSGERPPLDRAARLAHAG
jgi:hypothetical protein